MADRGIVLEITEKKCIVIDRNGIMREVRKQNGAKVGDEIEIKPEITRLIRYSATVFAAGFILFFALTAYSLFIRDSGRTPEESDYGSYITISDDEVPLAGPELPDENTPVGIYIGTASGVLLIIAASYFLSRGKEKKNTRRG